MLSSPLSVCHPPSPPLSALLPSLSSIIHADRCRRQQTDSQTDSRNLRQRISLRLSVFLFFFGFLFRSPCPHPHTLTHSHTVTAAQRRPHATALQLHCTVALHRPRWRLHSSPLLPASLPLPPQPSLARPPAVHLLRRPTHVRARDNRSCWCIWVGVSRCRRLGLQTSAGRRGGAARAVATRTRRPESARRPPG